MVDTLYATTIDLRKTLGIEDTLDDELLTLAVTSASRWIDRECARRFYRDALVDTGDVDVDLDDLDVTLARTYQPSGTTDLEVDDFDPSTPIVVELDVDGDGTFASALTLNADYFALPLNRETGWPCTALRRIGAGWPVTVNGRPTVRVAARWGWPAVPDAVKQACLIRAMDIFKQKDAPFGVAGFGDFGAVRVRANAEVDDLLFPYRRRSKRLIA